MKQTTRVNYLLGAGLIFFGAVFFAGKAVLVKYNYLHYHVDTVSLLALRMLSSLPFYLIILAFKQKKNENVQKITIKQWSWIVILGIVGYYLASLFDFWGLNYITASVERLILFLYPTIVVIISAIFLKKPIFKIQYFALIITYLGVLCAFIPDLQIGLQKNLVIGSVLIFLSAFTYALYLIGSGEMIPKIGSTRFTCYAMIVSTIIVMLHYALTAQTSLFSYQIEVYYLSVSMAVFCTVIPSFMISEGIKRIGSGNASIIGSVGPVATIVMANLFLDEKINGLQLLGTFIVLAGVLMVSWKGKK
ncbi:Threonine/homoserine efflux transporter RhtA [Pseudarcicella hirudinis]|uniref:Threonine/homoserine efflux transporter RhtA n=1 Tax=Pseudarcicella hirudinis TaxID=1079859 RepID=A0A1I5Q8R3_9BACT|nr:DMT family transporter [Pseudarcicella hirudinis]SFP42401.1 Threonine/homoserine efflux transporter RhtA [Pseudarcicella hirudinis]